MARYQFIDTSPRFIALDLQHQLLPGTFEHALNHLLDHEIDLSTLDTRYCNDLTGATAYPPATLIKLVLFAYAQGVVSSRRMESLCREYAVFIASSGDSQPHFTTIASFIPDLFHFRPTPRSQARSLAVMLPLKTGSSTTSMPALNGARRARALERIDGLTRGMHQRTRLAKRPLA